MINLAEYDYPLIFLKNPTIKRKFKRELELVEKSDYFRLEYLYVHGGIYADLDNNIDYPCLMKLLEPYRTQGKLVFMTAIDHNRKVSK
jgi:mannosyltransferase OCH1-like enzyme